MTLSKVYDANVYFNKNNTHGQASEVTCPTISAKMSDYSALGMVGTAQFFNGFDAMEVSIKWNAPDSAVRAACANFMKPVDLMIRSTKSEFGIDGITDEKPIVIYLKGYSKQHAGGTYKAGEDCEFESTFTVLYYKEEIDGESIVEIDVLNNIYKVEGEDLLANRRENLGI